MTQSLPSAAAEAVESGQSIALTTELSAESPERSPESAAFDPFADPTLPPPDLWSDEPPLESDPHRRQIELLIRLLEWYWRDRTELLRNELLFCTRTHPSEG